MAFLRGWIAIANYCGRSQDTLERWNRVLPMPIAKLGRSIQSSPALLDAWLVKAGRTLAAENTKGKRLYIRTREPEPVQLAATGTDGANPDQPLTPRPVHE